MRILVATLGSYGDVYPFIALASLLQQRRNDVTLLTNEFFEPLAGPAKLPEGIRHFDYVPFSQPVVEASRLIEALGGL